MIRAHVIASTVLHRDRLSKETPYVEHPFPSAVETVLCADELAEFVGRTAYQSWGRPNERTATNGAYLAAVLDKGFLKTLEHAHVTFYLTGLSASEAADLASRRHLSVLRVDQRFVDSSTAEYTVPAAFEFDDKAEADIADLFEDCLELFDSLTARLVGRGVREAEAKEAARAVLPNCTETELVVTGSMRAWREVIEKASVGDELSDALLIQLRDVAPNSFQDMIGDAYVCVECGELECELSSSAA